MGCLREVPVIDLDALPLCEVTNAGPFRQPATMKLEKK